jgi:hypothetical protein
VVLVEMIDKIRDNLYLHISKKELQNLSFYNNRTFL